MTLQEHFKAGYELFGPEAMEIAAQFFGGDIDFDTFMDRVVNPVINYRIHRMMWDEIEETNPKMIKMTSKFSDYLDKQSVIEWVEESEELLNEGVVGQFDSIPVEIDDTIEDEYYEFVY